VSQASQPEKPISGPCPFCRHSGGSITCSFDEGVLLHTLPPCETYLRLSADEFVQAVIDKKHMQ